jgi:SAM-dependent methyltransferase
MRILTFRRIGQRGRREIRWISGMIAMRWFERLLRMNNRVCPWWLCYSFDNPLRRLVHDPERILNPHVNPGMTAVDIGCGMGCFTLGLAKLVGPGGKVIAVDLQEEMLAALGRRARKAGLFCTAAGRTVWGWRKSPISPSSSGWSTR